MNNLHDLVESWPERARVSVWVRLYTPSRKYSVSFRKLREMFAEAKRLRVQENITMNLNRVNGVTIDLDNYVMRADAKGESIDNWGYPFMFVWELAKMFPGEVVVDSPISLERYVIGRDCEIVETIIIDDGAC